MKTTSTLFSILPLSVSIFVSPLGASAADAVIDSFVTPQEAPGGGIRNVADGSGVLGGERDIDTFLNMSANGAVANQMQIWIPINSTLTGRAGGDITYDGNDNNPSGSSFSGLGSIDLTGGGSNDRFRFEVTSVSQSSATLSFQLLQYSGSTKASEFSMLLPTTPGIYEIPFSSFVFLTDPFYQATGPVDFHSVGYANLHFEMVKGESITIDNIIAVPEPSVLALGLGVAALLLRRRFRCLTHGASRLKGA